MRKKTVTKSGEGRGKMIGFVGVWGGGVEMRRMEVVALRRGGMGSSSSTVVVEIPGRGARTLASREAREDVMRALGSGGTVAVRTKGMEHGKDGPGRSRGQTRYTGERIFLERRGLDQVAAMRALEEYTQFLKTVEEVDRRRFLDSEVYYSVEGGLACVLNRRRAYLGGEEGVVRR